MCFAKPFVVFLLSDNDFQKQTAEKSRSANCRKPNWQRFRHLQKCLTVIFSHFPGNALTVSRHIQKCLTQTAISGIAWKMIQLHNIQSQWHAAESDRRTVRATRGARAQLAVCCLFLCSDRYSQTIHGVEMQLGMFGQCTLPVRSTDFSFFLSAWGRKRVRCFRSMSPTFYEMLSKRSLYTKVCFVTRRCRSLILGEILRSPENTLEGVVCDWKRHCHDVRLFGAAVTSDREDSEMCFDAERFERVRTCMSESVKFWWLSGLVERWTDRQWSVFGIDRPKIASGNCLVLWDCCEVYNSVGCEIRIQKKTKQKTIRETVTFGSRPNTAREEQQTERKKNPTNFHVVPHDERLVSTEIFFLVYLFHLLNDSAAFA